MPLWENQGIDFGHDVTEEDSEEKPEVPVETDEQKNEEGVSEEESATDNKTPVIKTADDSKTEDEETEDPSAEFNAEPNAAEVIEPVAITFFEYDSSDLEEAKPEGTIVIPHYLVGESGGQATSGDDLEFQLEVQDGWQEAGLVVNYRIENGTNSDGSTKYTSGSKVSAINGTYKIARNGDNGLKGAEKKKIFTGPIEIEVVATENTANLAVDTSVTGGVYFVEDGERGSVIAANSSKADISFSKFTEEITLLVKAEEDDTVKMHIVDKDGNEKTPLEMTRGAEVEIDSAKWAEYTIDPKTLEGYAAVATVVDSSFNVTKVAGADPAFAYALDTAAAKYTFGAVASLATNVPDTDEIKHFTLADATTAPDAKTKKTYLNTTVGTVEKRNVLVFTVTPAVGTKYDITGVKAELTADDASAVVLQTIEAATGSYDVVGSDPVEYYIIDLGDVDSTLITKNVTLTLKVDTSIKAEDEEFGVHKITFTGDLANVEINNADGSAALAASFDTEANSLGFQITPKDGYAITTGTNYNGGGNSTDKVVTVSYTKKYELTLTENGTKEYVETKVENKEFSLEETSLESGVYQLADVTNLVASNALKLYDGTGDDGWRKGTDPLVPSDEQTNYDENGKNAAFSYKDITIDIRTTTENNQSGSFTVESEELEYTVETGNGVEPGDRANKYNISEEAEFVVLNVTAPAGVPTVTYNANESGTTVFAESKMVKDGDTYTVKIPVMSLDGFNANGVDSDIYSTIVIERGTYTFSVVDGSDSVFTGNIKVGDYTGAYDSILSAKRDIPKGDTIPVVLSAPTGTELATVKVETGTGADKKTEDITLGEDKSKVELSLAMTDNVKVIVTTNNIYNVTLTRDPAATEIIQDADGVYVVPFGAKNIVTTLKMGPFGTPTIAYAKLYDGGQEAATKVTVQNTNQAKIAAIDSKDTGVLRLDLAVKNGNKLVVVSSVQIKQEQMASKISITDPYDGSTVTEFNQAPDSMPATYNVKAEEGSLAFTDSTVVMELAADATRTTGTQAVNNVIENNDVKITFDPSEGTLNINAKPSVTGDKSYVLRFYDKTKRAEAAKTNADDRICAVEGGTIDVKIAPPAVKNANFKAEALDATNTKLKIQVSSDDITLNPVNDNGIFYRVTLDSKDKLGTGITKRTWYEERTGKSQVLELTVNPDTMTKDGNTEEYSDPQEFHPTVELVQTTQGYTTVETQGNSNKLAKSDAVALTISTKEARYEHDLTLSPAKATVYLGQISTVATTAQFGEKTGFTGGITTEFINTKTNKKVSISGLSASANNQTGEISISATGVANSYLKNNPAVFKNLGLRVYATAPGVTQKSSAVLALSVVAGVNNISFENGYNQEIYKVSGKTATLKIKAVLNDGLKENAPKKKKFVYALGDKDGNLPGEADYVTPSVAVMGNVKVNQKNGTVTVAKGYEVDTKTADNNKFSVVAQEVYSGSRAAVKVTITGTAQAVNSIVIVDQDGKVVAADGVLRADDFYNGTTYKKLYVKALSATAGTKREYGAVGTTAYNEASNANYMTGVKYTSSAKSVLSVDSRNGELKLLKASNKPVKLTVAAADGSKSKGQTITITVQSYSAVGLQVINTAYGVNNAKSVENPVVKYDGATNAQFTLSPMVKVNGSWVNAPSDYFKNLNLKIKKAKKVKLAKTATWWSIIKTDSVSTITVSDKTNKSVKTAYEITQNPAAPAGAKALKVKSLTKLTQAMIESARNAADYEAGKIKIKYQITGKDKGLYTGQYIMITPDYSKTKEVAGVKEYVRAQINFLNYENFKMVKVGADDTFEFDLDMYQMTNEQRIPGNYTLIATAGTYSNGVFTPATKGASIKVKIPGKAPKALSLKLNGNYSLDESGAPVSIGTGISSGLKWYLGTDLNDNSAVGTDYAKNMIDPETGKANNFTKYFEVLKTDKKDMNGNRVYALGLKSGLKIDDIAKLRENEKDLKGYVTVQTSDQRQDMLITVSITDSVITAKANDSYKGGEASVQFYAGNDTANPLNVAGVYIDQKASEGTPSFAKSGTHVEADGKTVKVKLGAAEKDNSYKVTFKVLAAGSAYASADKATVNDTFVEKYGRTVTATFKVVDPAKVTGAVWFEAVDQNNGLAFTAFSAETYDKAKNTYSLDIKQKSKIDGAQINVIKIDSKDASGKAFEGTGIVGIKKKTGETDVFTLTLDRDKFLKAADSETSSLKRGAEVEIPVNVTYTNREIPAETISVKVAMPDPMDVDAAIEAAKAAVAEAEQIKVVDLENRNPGGNIMLALQNSANAVLLKAVPMDAVADVNLPITLAPVTTTGENPVTTWDATINIKEKKADKTAKWTYTLKYAPETQLLTAMELKNEIIDKKAAIEGLVISNDYTADMLKADVLKLLADDNKSVPNDLEVVIKNFTMKNATVKANGKVTAEIYVYNAKTKQTTYATDVNITITKLGNIGENGSAISSAVGAIIYQTVIYNALKDGGLSTVENALEDAITKAATGAIRNSAVTVELETITKAANSASAGDYSNEGWSYDAEDSRYVFFKLPTGAAAGSVEFKLVVKQAGMQDYTIDKTGGNKITVANTMTVGGVSGVKVFQNLDEAATNVAKTSGGDAIFTTTEPTAAVEGEVKDAIDKKTEAEIAAEVAKRAKALITGVGLDVTAEVNYVTEEKTDPEANATDKALGGEDALYAHGVITITDTTGRADDEKTLKFVVLVPAGGIVVSDMDVKATVQKGSTAAVDATGASIEVNDISTETVTIKFTPELKGYWLTDANKKFTYELVDPDNDNNPLQTAPNGVTMATDGTLTITPGSVDLTTRDDADGLELTVMVTHDITGGTYPDSYTTPKSATIAVTVKFTTPKSAKAVLEAANYLDDITVEYQLNAAENGWEITDAAKAALATAVQAKLREETGYKSYTVSVKSAVLDGTWNADPTDQSYEPPTKADVVFTVNVGSETAVDTSTIEVTAEEAKQ